jgi:hypothetical protein
MKHLHVGGSAAKAMNLIEKHFPTVRYLYYLQHDFYFAKEVNHMALISAMDKYPDKINYVFFQQAGVRGRIKPCGEESPINLNTETNATTTTTTEANATKMIQPQASPVLLPTATYTDNNHLVRFQWYKATIESLIFLARFPENPLQKRANDACAKRSNERMGLYAYQEPRVLVHLDGRHNPGINRVSITKPLKRVLVVIVLSRGSAEVTGGWDRIKLAAKIELHSWSASIICQGKVLRLVY